MEDREQGKRLELRAEPECVHPHVDGEGRFAFRSGSPGSRYYLDGVDIHAGDELEMQSDDGVWQRVRFEWEQDQALKPVLFVGAEEVIPLPEDARFRWPER